MILILSRADDAHARAMGSRLGRRGVPYVQLGHASFPREASVSARLGVDEDVRVRFSWGDRTVDLAEVSAVWYRRPERPVLDEGMRGESYAPWVEAQCTGLLEDAYATHDGLWLPAKPARLREATAKAWQLRLARTLGFEIPPTLVTNDPRAALDFWQAHEGDVVRKAVVSADVFAADGARIRTLTYPLSLRDLGHMQDVRLCPVILQARVPKRVELRVTVVGERVFAAEIDSQQSRHARDDWRNHDMAHTPHRPHDLPLALAKQCAALVVRLGLLYGAIDLILTPDGRYVFVEINPNGEYQWIEALTGLPIGDAVCDLLVSRESTAQ